MNRKVLFVDDDVNLLESFKRQLRKKAELTTAEGPKAGIEAAARQGPFSVVISDYNMPVMNGVDMLRVIRHGSPDTVRVLLTGHADLEIAIQAVNEGNIFRLLTKPCPPETIEKVLDDAFRHHDLITAEKELLEQTLRGSVAVLCDLISLVKPDVFGRVSRILPHLRGVSRRLADPRAWETETAAMLSVVGFITLPDSLINKVEKGKLLIRVMIERALLGCPTCLKLCAERLMPAKRESTVQIKVPKIETLADVPAAMQAVADQVFKGDITLGEGRNAFALLSAWADSMALANSGGAKSNTPEELVKRLREASKAMDSLSCPDEE